MKPPIFLSARQFERHLLPGFSLHQPSLLGVQALKVAESPLDTEEGLSQSTVLSPDWIP